MHALTHARLNLAELQRARERVRPLVHRTPVITCSAIDAMVGCRVFFKCENLQKVGAFKFRGACNAVFSLGETEARGGVVTHSSGNHAAALALAAKMRGIAAHIVMPDNAPAIKKSAVEGYGGRITLCPPTQAAREAVAQQLQQSTGATFVHPYDDDRVIAGQSTATQELLEDVRDLDAILAPVGGGGLLGGTCLAAKQLQPGICVFGCEPALSDDAAASLREGRVVPQRATRSIADGLLTSLSRRTFDILREWADGIEVVDDARILHAQRTIMERMKIVVETSASVPLAVLLRGFEPLRGKRVGVILSGGNVDLSRMFPA